MVASQPKVMFRPALPPLSGRRDSQFCNRAKRRLHEAHVTRPPAGFARLFSRQQACMIALRQRQV